MFVNYLNGGCAEKIVEVYFIFQGEELVTSEFYSRYNDDIVHTETFTDAHEQLIRNYYLMHMNERQCDEPGLMVDVRKSLAEDYRGVKSNN